MSPDRINDAVKILEASGYVKTLRALGTAPYDFRGVELTPAGRLEYEESIARRTSAPKQSPTPNRPPTGDRVFLGHGRSLAWRELKDFLADRLGLEWDEFNRESTAGLSTKERLESKLDSSAFAFLILTAEDERSDGVKTARANVIHEAGLFQGRLGFKKSIVLLEDGCEEFSNIVGITEIRFPPGKIKAAFEEVRRVLEREGVIAP